MRRTIETMTRRAVAALGIGACLASAAGALHAQTWMAAYGDGGIDMGRGGVIALPSDGGIVAAGLYDSPFNYHDIFVLKTDGCYTTQWMKRYDLGGYEHATKIRRTADGGFIVVGYAQVAEHCGTVNDIILLRLDASGNPIWARTYGGSGDEMGYDVQVAPDGFIVAGSTTSYGAGGSDGLLMKTDPSGAVIWTTSYGTTGNDFFTSCAIAADGTILVTGARNHTTAPHASQMYQIRFSSTGISSFPLAGGGNGENIGRRILECPNLDVVIAGSTTDAGDHREVYMTRTDFAGVPIAQTMLGSIISASEDEALDMVATPHGHFLITGIISQPTNGHGGIEMLGADIDGSLGLVTAEVLGGIDTDEGWGIDYVPNPKGFPEYVAVGATKSFGLGWSDLYLVRREIGDQAACTNFAAEELMNVSHPRFPFERVVDHEEHDLPFGCDVPVTARDVGTVTLICSDCIGNPSPKPAIGETGAAAPADASGVLPYPNPVRKGATLTLRYAASPDGVATVQVSDISGTVILERSVDGAAGEATLSTEGWAPGAYVVQVKTGTVVSTGRVMIGE